MLGLTEQQLAEVIGVTYQQAHKYERGINRVSAGRLFEIARALSATLKQIDTSNVKQLKGAWMTRLKGSGYGGKYSFEGTPLIKDGVMYIVTGNDDVFALNAKTGEFLWERWSGIDQKLTSVCCGWDNRGLAMGEGMLFLGQLDANVVALDIKTGKATHPSRQAFRTRRNKSRSRS